MFERSTDTDSTNRQPITGLSRRDVLRTSAVSGALGVSGLLTTSSASAQQGGVAYLKKKHLYGRNAPTETRYKIVGQCSTTTKTTGCDSGRERTYARYQIRCPNFPGGGNGGGNGNGNGHDGDHGNGHDGVGAAQHDDENGDHGECPGGDGDGGGHGTRCGRHILVNPNRNVAVSLDQLYEFVVVHDCTDDGDEESYVKAAFKPVRG